MKPWAFSQPLPSQAYLHMHSPVVRVGVPYRVSHQPAG